MTTLGEAIRAVGGSVRTGPFGTALAAWEYTPDGAPVISVGEVGVGSFRITGGTRRVPVSVTRRMPEYILRAGDIVFGRKGAVDRSALVRDSQAGYFLGSDGIRLRLGAGIEPEYVAYWLQTVPSRDWMVRHSVGTTMLTLTQSVLESLPLRLPDLKVQRGISRLLRETDELIETYERSVAKKRAMKQGMMQSVFGGSHPEKERVALGSIVGFLSGGTPNRSHAAYWEGDIPWISATTLRTLEVSASDQGVTKQAVTAGSKMAPLGSTLILVRGSALHSEIRAALVVAPLCFNQDVKALVPVERVVPKFLTYAIHANADRLLRLVTSAGNTAGVLDTKVLKALQLWLPSRGEQQRIVSIFDDVAADIDVLERRLESTRAIKQGMMQELLTGRTRLVSTEASA